MIVVDGVTRWQECQEPDRAARKGLQKCARTVGPLWCEALIEPGSLQEFCGDRQRYVCVELRQHPIGSNGQAQTWLEPTLLTVWYREIRT